MQARHTTGRRTVGARKPAAVAMAAAGALGGIAVAKRRRAASADEPLEPGGLPQLDGATAAEGLLSEPDATATTKGI